MGLPPGLRSQWEGQHAHQKGRPQKTCRVSELRYKRARYWALVEWDDGGWDLVQLASLQIIDKGGQL